MQGGHGGRGPGPHGGPKVKLKDGRGTALRLLRYLGTVKKQLTIALIALVLSNVAALMAPLFSGRLIDTLVGQQSSNQLLNLVLIMLGLYIASSCFSWIQQILLVEVSQRTVRQLREDLFARIQVLPLKLFDSTTHGELMSRLTNDVDNVSNMLSQSLTQVFSSTITLIASLSLMLYLSPLLTLITLLLIPVSMLIVRKVTSYTGKLFIDQQASLGDLNGIIEETVTGARVIKVFSREEMVIEEFDEANERMTQVGIKATVLSSIMGPLMNVINNISYALVAAVGGWLCIRGSVSIGMIQSFLQYSRQFTRPLNEIANQITTVQQALAGAERVFEIMDSEPEAEDAKGAYDLGQVKGRVDFNDVSFGYTPEKMILDHVTFEAKPGQTIALVGPTGAGKTTIVNLLMRFYDLDGGNVLVDDHDITTVKRQSLRNNMGMVLQDVYLFSGTVRDNICYGKLDATEEEMIEAAKMANCHSFISRLPKGYDTELSEGGSNLSQGQRQLLSIARAILADPKVLILDEATSSVDTRTEMKIQSAMLTLMKGRTSFVIAHRLSTIRNADMILVLKDGNIIERGTHKQLMDMNGFYAELSNSQYRASIAV